MEFNVGEIVWVKDKDSTYLAKIVIVYPLDMYRIKAISGYEGMRLDIELEKITERDKNLTFLFSLEF